MLQVSIHAWPGESWRGTNTRPQSSVCGDRWSSADHSSKSGRGGPKAESSLPSQPREKGSSARKTAGTPALSSAEEGRRREIEAVAPPGWRSFASQRAGSLAVRRQSEVTSFLRTACSGSFVSLARECPAGASSAPSTRVIYLALDYRKTGSSGVGTDTPNPFANLKVREAVARAIDKNAIVKTVMGGLATPATQFVAPFVTGYDRLLKPLSYNLETAKKLMVDAGYPNGFNLRLDATNDRYLNDALIAQAVAGMLERIGIKTRVNAVSRTVLFPQLDKGDFSAFIGGWGSTDLGSTLISQVMCKNPKEGWGSVNRVGYCNSDVDKLILQANSSFSPAERKKLFSAAMRQALLKDYLWIPLHLENVIHGFNSRDFAYKARGDEYIYTWEIAPR